MGTFHAGNLSCLQGLNSECPWLEFGDNCPNGEGFSISLWEHQHSKSSSLHLQLSDLQLKTTPESCWGGGEVDFTASFSPNIDWSEDLQTIPSRETPGVSVLFLTDTCPAQSGAGNEPPALQGGEMTQEENPG